MVAIAGKGWVLAPSLRVLVEETDRLWPGRDWSSDGSIGDQAHASRTSDHNPFDGFVHAVDLDEDIAPGRDMKAFAESLRVRRDPRIRYVIYEGRIFKSYPSTAGPAWAWLEYTGPNDHLHHVHISINRTTEARDDLRGWWLTKEDDMGATEQAQLDSLGQMLSSVGKQIDSLGQKVDSVAANLFDADDRAQLDNVRADVTTAIQEIRVLAQAVGAVAVGDTATAEQIVDEIAERLA